MLKKKKFYAFPFFFCKESPENLGITVTDENYVLSLTLVSAIFLDKSERKHCPPIKHKCILLYMGKVAMHSSLYELHEFIYYGCC